MVSAGGLQERDVKFFTETEENTAMMAPRSGVPYFL
jgi:serine/threonine-protein phosphatase 6 catalytic subunit